MVLGVLASVLVVRRLWPYLTPAEDPGAMALAGPEIGDEGGDARRGQRGRGGPLVVAELRDPALGGDGAASGRAIQVGRNPFRFGTPPPPPPPTAEELAMAARRRAEEEALRRSLEAQRLEELSRPHPPEFPWKYLGNFGPERRQVAVFSDGENIYNALEGDVLDGRFIVARIGYESVDIRFVGFPDVPAQRLGVSGDKG
jgi:hypothetical protein